MSSSSLLQFQPFTSSPNVSFFQKLAQLKLDTYQLSDAAQDITGSFELNSHSSVPPRFLVHDTSFGFDAASLPNRCKHEWTVPGVLINTNTLEDFKNLDKGSLLDNAKSRILHAIESYDSTSLQTFVLCTFADLKTHTYWYRFAFPAVVPSTEAYKLVSDSWTPSHAYFASAQQQALVRQLVGRRLVDQDGVTSENFPPAFLFDPVASTLHDLKDIQTLDPSALVFGIVDPSALSTNPGWPLRNFLAWISRHCPNLATAKVLLFRDQVHHLSADNTDVSAFRLRASYVATVELAPYDPATTKVVGWELNVQGKMGPRHMQLANLLDPLHLAKTSVDLNLKLMRWRQLPNLDLEKLGQTKCLLLGAGTLGCHFARNLLAWGFRSLTLVDYGKVSHSNPVRQPLYDYADVGEWKAPTAAKALKRIYPLVESEGHVLSIPMAGHALSNPQALQEARAAYDTLEAMIASHDVIFLGTDTRESRWLPTVLAAAHEKLVINAALGTTISFPRGVDGECQDDVAPRLSHDVGL
ncbi:E1-like protein-activating enzyme Gsa7p/Apg7p, variant [Aphanomyces invadans]|uniref:E1-like protein-activating enzyme Gsa7p/Apg7p, variant n=1 Tax=Aphanomyces invadans TaxID=157072 RepID=A0A024U8P4_9STRA|nr:E1-like protein-activating enzyme Gsa7p/Apg7p, variant [Aphanomyces invadans]ETW02791.1 E1-like protein-activating enzyme Gsa7p/Apg7p, variant [Aphanomyces invadans]|eukprot:XP_008868175.1 E1-like protein-activating enzyme Gsa7p/Apg7p, variant [Aphanomyces invadans]